MNSHDNPYTPPPSITVDSSPDLPADESSRVRRYAMLGGVAGIGFAIAVLAIRLVRSARIQAIDDLYFTIDYGNALFAFGFWAVSAGIVFSVLGWIFGAAADVLYSKRTR